MNFLHEDDGPEQLLNEAIWKSIRGAERRMPAPQHSLYKASDNEDDD